MLVKAEVTWNASSFLLHSTFYTHEKSVEMHYRILAYKVRSSMHAKRTLSTPANRSPDPYNGGVLCALLPVAVTEEHLVVCESYGRFLPFTDCGVIRCKRSSLSIMQIKSSYVCGCSSLTLVQSADRTDLLEC
jgi:hypothetical protein